MLNTIRARSENRDLKQHIGSVCFVLYRGLGGNKERNRGTQRENFRKVVELFFSTFSDCFRALIGIFV